MASGDIGAVIKGVETLFNAGTAAGLTDLQLLQRFAGRRDDGAEAAFAALVKRHGPMVLRVCRGELEDLHAAEDAFQATFLILARKARSIRKGGSLASWLYGVARRVARRARVDRARRAARQRRGAAMAENPVLLTYDPPEFIPEIQEEVDRLPEKYRTPILLCYLEGLTHEEAASQLRIPVGTVKIRLSRGRERLRGRLVRRGLAPALIASALSASSRGAVPTSLLDITVKAAMQVAAVRAAGVSAAVAALVEGVLRTMFLSQLRTIAALAATSMTLIVTSLLVVSALSRPVRSDQEPTPTKVPVVVKAPAPQDPEKPERGAGVTVKKSVFHRTTTQPGTVQAFHRVELYPAVSGVLSALEIDIGDRVKKGQTLAKVYVPELRLEAIKTEAMGSRVRARLRTAMTKVTVAEAALNAARAQIEVSEAQFKQAEATLNYRKKQHDRLTGLVQRHAVEERIAEEEADRLMSAQATLLAAKAQVTVEKTGLEGAQAKLETAHAEADEGQADLRLAEADLEKARMALDSCEIRSPLDGVVTQRHGEPGGFARAATIGGSVPLLTVVRADIVRVVVQVPDRDAPYLDVGDRVTFRADARDDREYRGVISRTAFAEDPTTRTLRAELELPNADGGLRPGQAGSVTVNLADYANVITIPMQALVDYAGPNAPGSCYRVVEGRTVRTPIKLGMVNPDNGTAEVLDGLKEGDTIIPDQNKIRDHRPPAPVDR